MTITRRELEAACDLSLVGDWALTGDWEGAHAIVQRDEAGLTCCWIHAVLHKIEGDTGNARYWYRLAGRPYDAYAAPHAELAAIRRSLAASGGDTPTEHA